MDRRETNGTNGTLRRNLIMFGLALGMSLISYIWLTAQASQAKVNDDLGGRMDKIEQNYQGLKDDSASIKIDIGIIKTNLQWLDQWRKANTKQ